jgi:Ca2+-binding RTX toxin-like protein
MSSVAKTIIGTSADEFIFGTSADDVIVSRSGIDVVFGRDGNDTIVETVDENRLTKFSHDDFYFGGAGDDTLITAGGHDVLSGGAGNDNFTCYSNDSFVVRGGKGNDILHLNELAHYTETHENGATVLTLDSDFTHQVIYAYNVEEIRYDAAHPM